MAEPLSLMGERVRKLWISGQLSEEGLDRAVDKGWINAEQKAEILATPKS